MAVYKIFPIADSTLYSLFPSQNTGLDEILEVSVKNAKAITEDLRRSVILFSNDDIEKIKNLVSGEYAARLKMYLSVAEGLSIPYTLNFNQITDNWVMGTGKFDDDTATTDGVCWYSTSSYESPSSTWSSPEYLTVAGGGSWNSTICSQSFYYSDNKDVNADVTNIVTNWFNGDDNNGIIVKHPQEIENNLSSSIILNFYSIDTHTIFPPCLEIKWDDSIYTTGSLTQIDTNTSVVNITNNPGSIKRSTNKYQFRISARDQFPKRLFTTSSIYMNSKCLSSSSYWAIQDLKTEDTIIDFDQNYTKISCDGTSSYFDVYTSNLEPERYYRLLIKTLLDSGEEIVYDNNSIFKIVR